MPEVPVAVKAGRTARAGLRMSHRQRDVLRAVRGRARAEAVAIHQQAQARDGAARAHLQALQDAWLAASAPPAAGTMTRVDREARRRHHLARLRIALQAARAEVQAAGAALAQAAAAVRQRVRDVQAVDVLDARADDAARRAAARRAESDAEDRNRPISGSRMDDDALQ